MTVGSFYYEIKEQFKMCPVVQIGHPHLSADAIMTEQGMRIPSLCHKNDPTALTIH